MASTGSFIRTTLIMMVIGVVIMLGIVGSSLWLVQKNSEYSDRVAELRRIRTSIIDVIISVQDAETGQRGFLMTRNADYLAPYTSAIAILPAKQERLTNFARTNQAYARQIDELNTLIDRKMYELEQTIALTKQGQTAQALELVRANSGQDYMVQIRTILNGYLEATDNWLRVLVRDQLAAADNLQWVTIGGALSMFFVLAVAVIIIIQHIRDLSHAREEVEVLNAGLEARVNERTQDLIQANQEIQRFAYIVTHDLRAPLVNIMGFLSELENATKALTAYVLGKNQNPTPEQAQQARIAVEEDLPEAVTFIRSSTRKMDALINAILKISRDGKRKLVPERVKLQAMIDQAADSLHSQIAASHGEIKINVRVGDIVTDRFSLDQIFGNLFDNAVKYQFPDRPLRLHVNAVPYGREHVRIEFKDNGRGIARHDLERIFELFRRAGEQDQTGEGIGLAHVRSLIRNLGGDIKVESELGVGSTFILTLPTDLAKIVRSMDG